MSSVLRPVGPERPTTYWRRRLVAVVVLLLLVLGVALGVRALTGDDEPATAATRLDPAQVSPGPLPTSPTAGGTADPSPSATSTATPTASAAAAPCEDGDVTLTLTTDATAYGPDATPKLALTVTNTSARACSAEIGAGVRSFTATAADGTRVWASDDCQSTGSSQVYVLQPEGTRAMSTTWSRQGSAPGCPDDRPTVAAGSYALTGTWEGTTSAPVTVSLAG